MYSAGLIVAVNSCTTCLQRKIGKPIRCGKAFASMIRSGASRTKSLRTRLPVPQNATKRPSRMLGSHGPWRLSSLIRDPISSSFHEDIRKIHSEMMARRINLAGSRRSLPKTRPLLFWPTTRDMAGELRLTTAGNLTSRVQMGHSDGNDLWNFLRYSILDIWWFSLAFFFFLASRCKNIVRMLLEFIFSPFFSLLSTYQLYSRLQKCLRYFRAFEKSDKDDIKSSLLTDCLNVEKIVINISNM